MAQPVNDPSARAPGSGRGAAAAPVGSRPVTPSLRIASALAAPLAPLYGAALAYMIYHPRRRPHRRTPEDVGITTARTVRVPIPPGPAADRRGYVDVWLIPGGTDRVVVVGHGIGQNKSASVHHARMLHDAGFTVCLFDHRNHGTSSHNRAIHNLEHLFTADVAAVVGYARAMSGYASAKVAVYGFSFSTFPVFFAPTRSDCRVDAIVCDSGPALHIPPLFANLLTVDGGRVPAPLRVRPARDLFLPVVSTLSTSMLGRGWPPGSERYTDTPVLLLAGERDAVIPAAAVAELAARYPSATLHVLPEVGHLRGLKTCPEDYRHTVLDFLDRVLR